MTENIDTKLNLIDLFASLDLINSIKNQSIQNQSLRNLNKAEPILKNNELVVSETVFVDLPFDQSLIQELKVPISLNNQLPINQTLLRQLVEGQQENMYLFDELPYSRLLIQQLNNVYTVDPPISDILVQSLYKITDDNNVLNKLNNIIKIQINDMQFPFSEKLVQSILANANNNIESIVKSVILQIKEQ